MPTLPDNIAAKLRSGLLSDQEVDDRLRFWSGQGVDMSEWAKPNTACPHYSRGCCRLAAVVAKVPVDHARIQIECRACQRETSDPDISNVPQSVKDLSERAKSSWQGTTPPTKTAKKTNTDGLSEDDAFAKFPCIHRTKTGDFHTCKSCGGGGRVHTLCDCSLLHRKCTVLTAADAKDPTDKKRVETCMSCEHREAPLVTKMDYLTTIHGKPADLANLYQGGTCVLVCGGPSLNQTDLTPIDQRGITVAAINNVGVTHVRPHLWFSMDNMKKFHPTILQDPGILKFINGDKTGNRLRLREGNDWRELGAVKACPNVFVYSVKSGDKINSKNFMGGPMSYRFENEPGRYKSATMAVALRILLDLGFSRIGIVGADFHMGESEQYAWNEEKDTKAQSTNNGLYGAMNKLFEAAAPGIAKQGRLVVNCSVGGNLTAFPRMDLGEFCRLGLEKFPKFTTARGYYVDKPLS